MDDIINWSALGVRLGGTRFSRDYIPKKHRYKVSLLREHLNSWEEKVREIEKKEQQIKH